MAGNIGQPPPGSFGARLQELQSRAGLDNKQLAKEVGLDPGAVSRHRRALRPPSSDSVQKYALYFQVSQGHMMTGVDDPTWPAHEPVALGAAALEEVLVDFVWPDIEVSQMEHVFRQARAEAETATDRPASVWKARLYQLIRATVPDILDRPPTPAGGNRRRKK